ncbi:18531_t:CDS:2, partial [Funneliformis geosporum]
MRKGYLYPLRRVTDDVNDENNASKSGVHFSAYSASLSHYETYQWLPLKACLTYRLTLAGIRQ